MVFLNIERKLAFLKISLALQKDLTREDLQAIIEFYKLPQTINTGTLSGILNERGIFNDCHVLGFRDLLYAIGAKQSLISSMTEYFQAWLRAKIRPIRKDPYTYMGCKAMYQISDDRNMLNIQCCRTTVGGTNYCNGHQQYPNVLANTDNYELPGVGIPAAVECMESVINNAINAQVENPIYKESLSTYLNTRITLNENIVAKLHRHWRKLGGQLAEQGFRINNDLLEEIEANHQSDLERSRNLISRYKQLLNSTVGELIKALVAIDCKDVAKLLDPSI